MLSPGTFTFGKQVHLQNIQVSFVYQDYRVEVEVAAARKHVCASRSQVVCLQLIVLLYYAQ